MLKKIDKSVDSGKKYDKIDPNILKKVEKSVNSTKNKEIEHLLDNFGIV